MYDVLHDKQGETKDTTEYVEKENPIMNMSIDTLSYVLKLRKRMDDLESMLQHMDAGNHSSAKLNLPMGRREDPGNWIEVWVPAKVQRELALAEMLKIKTEMLLSTVSAPSNADV
tara:strand:+ start:309 stop:653 length:345 start_codon:yes stop_codon:yes gene_type:complete